VTSVPLDSFAIHVTYTCPLACAHCCFSSDPHNRDRLHIDHIKATIDHIPREIGLIAFTGGEPFLLGANLIDLVRLAASRGAVTRIVTSAYWATTPKAADRWLQALSEAGLNELSISWDDFHEEFVDFSCIKNAWSSAKSVGITVGIATVQAAASKWNNERIRTELGLAEGERLIQCEMPLNRTGRAAEALQDAGQRYHRSLGPCPFVLTGPTLSAKNKLLACCGVIPETDQLILDGDFRPENLRAAIESGMRNALLNWLFLRGPYHVMEWIGNRWNVAIPPKSEVGGNCEACACLFTTPGIRERVVEAANEMAKSIADEMSVLDALGLLNRNGVLGLWQTESQVYDDGSAGANSPRPLPLLPA
jgi:organic radical activating enzyme